MLRSVVVGESICGGVDDASASVGDDGAVLLRGYNTYSGSTPANALHARDGAGEVVAALCGVVDVTDRVVSVKGRVTRYMPEIGDVVVGRVVEVSGNRWLVDINASQLAVLLLSNVTEPGGMLRRRTRGDELSMRLLFDQDDLIVAEVQRIAADGTASLHTRAGDKYGRIRTAGVLVCVPACSVRRARRQVCTLPALGCSLVLGMNGWVWVSRDVSAHATVPSAATSDAAHDGEASAPQHDTAADDAVDEGAGDVRHNCARIANCIYALARGHVPLHSASIEAAVQASVAAQLTAFDVRLPQHHTLLCNAALLHV